MSKKKRFLKVKPAQIKIANRSNIKHHHLHYKMVQFANGQRLITDAQMNFKMQLQNN